MEAATSGDWGAFKSCTGRKHQGWEVHLADALQPADPHEAAHNHYSTLFSGPGSSDLPPLEPLSKSSDFTVLEVEAALAKGKPGKSVSHDGVSLELLKAIAEVPDGKQQLANMFSSILHSGDLPPNWHESVMVLLPKLAKPLTIKDTRPIAISSAVERVYSRLILHRCRDRLAPKRPWQACGPRRQSLDYLHCIHRLLESEREWQKGLAVMKLDSSRAFDSVDRKRLMLKLREILGATEETRAWERLLTDTSTFLCTPWNTSKFEIGVGIRQGAVESPLIFAALTEWVMEETIQEFHWKPHVSTYQDMTLTQGAYMDDVMMWEGSTKELETKVAQLQSKFQEWASRSISRSAPFMCHPSMWDFPNWWSVESSFEHNQPLGSWESSSKWEQGSWNLCSPLGPEPFWSISHLLRAKTPIAGRMRLLNRVVGASALWCCAAFAPERNALEAVNQLLY